MRAIGTAVRLLPREGQTSGLRNERCWKPVAPWVGRLVLPEDGARRDDGGVLMEILASPERSLVGKLVPVAQNADWVERVTVDIEFDKSTWQNISQGNKGPRRLNGWKRVSPLESLAGARAEDDMLVSLGDARWDGSQLRISEEPVQVSGSREALVRFEKKLSGKLWQVTHWDAEKRDFVGPSEVVQAAAEFSPMADRRLNRQGYYVYSASTKGEIRTITAAEPRALTNLQMDQVMLGERRSERYLQKENWRVESLRKGEWTKTVLDPVANEQDAPDIQTATDRHFRPGQEYLVMHLFGGKSDEKGPAGLTTGHFALGFAEVEKDDFTGEDRLDIEYRQVYANNPEGIVAGAMKWHAYMGSLDSQDGFRPRGWMYHRPVSDVILHTPELGPTESGYHPLDSLKERLSEMTSRYRTGEGDGAAIVTPAQSCSMDSAHALYATVQDWEQAVEDGQAGESLTVFAELLTQQITPLFGLAPASWRRTAAREPADPGRGKWLPALLSPKVVLPRDQADGLALKALRTGHSAVIIKTDIVGSEPAHGPVAASKVF